jgi:hypothetical protein
MNIETMIRAANPVRASDIEPADAPGPRRALEHILREPAPRRRPSARTIGVTAIAAAAAGAAAIVVIATLPGSPAPLLTHPPAGIAAAFRHLSLVADSQPTPPAPGPGQFLYNRSAGLVENCGYDAGPRFKQGYCVSYRHARQSWIGLDGSGRIKERFWDPRFPASRDRRIWVEASRPSLQEGPSDDKFGPHQLGLGPRNLLTLPTDPDKLAALLIARKIEGGPPGAAEDFVQVGDLLRETDAPPALRAALFQIAARIPGVTLLMPGDGVRHDQVGVAYADEDPNTGQTRKMELIFSRTTTALAAERTVLIDPATHKVTVQDSTIYIASGVVDSTTQTLPPSGS